MPIYRMDEGYPPISYPETRFTVDRARGGATYLYYLYDPSESPAPVRYIGITCNPVARFSHHISTAPNQRDFREIWLHSVLLKDVEPVMEVRKLYPSRAAAAWAERRNITRLRNNGYWLCNHTVIDKGPDHNPVR